MKEEAEEVVDEEWVGQTADLEAELKESATKTSSVFKRLVEKERKALRRRSHGVPVPSSSKVR
jgi:hypothetical protein